MRCNTRAVPRVRSHEPHHPCAGDHRHRHRPACGRRRDYDPLARISGTGRGLCPDRSEWGAHSGAVRPGRRNPAGHGDRAGQGQRGRGRASDGCRIGPGDRRSHRDAGRAGAANSGRRRAVLSGLDRAGGPEGAGRAPPGN